MRFPILALTVFCFGLLFGSLLPNASAIDDEKEVKLSKIELVSPDGKNSILIEATDEGPAIWMSNGKNGNDIAIYSRWSEGTAIGLRQTREAPAFNLALAIEKGSGSPFIQMIEGQAGKLKAPKVKHKTISLD